MPFGSPHAYRRDRVDSTQRSVVERLRALGCTVEIIGRPLDVLVGWRGVTILAEIKQPPGPRGGTSGKGRSLRQSQEQFFARWRGARPIILTIDTAIDAVTREVERQLGQQRKSQ